MELTFNKVGDLYVADFTAESDFALHIEKSVGNIRVLQSSIQNGQYDYVKNANINGADAVIDFDFTALVYPKYMRIESKVMPDMAVVTFA